MKYEILGQRISTVVIETDVLLQVISCESQTISEFIFQASSGERVAVKIERIVHAKGVSGTIRLKHEYEMLKEIYAVTNGKKTQGKKVPGKENHGGST